MRMALVILLLLAPVVTPAAELATRVLLVKHTRTLSLFRGNRLIGSYRVSLGPHPDGAKWREGDGRTPEGHYLLDRRNRHSAFYKSIHVSYPDTDDIMLARRSGASPGGDIMIHGQKNGLGWATLITQRMDWTRGCIAVSNTDMDRIWASVPAGTPIDIEP